MLFLSRQSVQVNVDARLNVRTCKSFLNVQQLLHVPAHSHRLVLPTFYSSMAYRVVRAFSCSVHLWPSRFFSVCFT